jgi:hypothetical protein
VPIRLYVLPLIIEGPGRIPKYLHGSTMVIAPNSPFSVTPYGLEDIGLCAVDTDTTSHQTLAAIGPPDVDVIPANLDNTIGAGALETTRTRMRSRGIPGAWLHVGSTWRELVRGILAIFAVGQRVAGSGGTRLLPPGVTLDTTMDGLTADFLDYQTLLYSVMDDKGYDRSSITGASTLEDLLEVIVAQAAPGSLLGMVI